jgi:Sec-independent protein secretion pathway component TatC
MRPRLKNPNNTPLSVVLIANAFLFVGGVVLAISILILLLGWFLYMDRHANVPGTERIGFLWMLSIMLGVPGIVLSATTIVSSVGLRKMRKWGLWCSYCTMAVLAILYIEFQGNRFPVTSPFGLFIHSTALMSIATEIYLTRIYWQYFTRKP